MPVVTNNHSGSPTANADQFPQFLTPEMIVCRSSTLTSEPIFDRFFTDNMIR